MFSEEDAVAPDIIWVSKDRLNIIDLESGTLRGAPGLIVEVLSPGPENERQDKRTKLQLYSRHGAKEYWVVDWQMKTIEVYRRRGTSLRLSCTLREEDTLTSSLRLFRKGGRTVSLTPK
ncbi:MAG TPA: Uma2 family endonuclease [Blastocatellia bacterium]|nr:Uma2 family endonuclease [Blastocatellia bacterium]